MKTTKATAEASIIVLLLTLASLFLVGSKKMANFYYTFMSDEVDIFTELQ